ncbi:MAG: DUF5777 family beta-barrel protein [Ignavibacteriales bacterium]|nr:DUF5777 family beta-barrel protein [Ignavibacteriales bacterium]
MKQKNFLSLLKNIFTILFLLPIISFGQDDHPSWQKSEPKEELDLHLFRSTQSINLPTIETLQKGDFEFEISHRFIPTIKSGYKKFYGFDGPVNMRIAFGYAPTNSMFICFGRSNLNNNVDLWVKQIFVQIPNDILPTIIGGRVGGAWNSNLQNPVPGRSDGDSKNFQYYGQLIFNTLFAKKLGVGLVPSYLYNSYIYTNAKQYSFTFGTYITYYVSNSIGLLFEWNPTVTGFRQQNNPVAFGFELNTGGHFFKIILTNSSQLNPSQYLAGTDNSFNSGDWHIGFNITRLLKF